MRDTVQWEPIWLLPSTLVKVTRIAIRGTETNVHSSYENLEPFTSLLISMGLQHSLYDIRCFVSLVSILPQERLFNF